MKIIYILAILMLACFEITGQTTSPIGITFGTKSYQVVDASSCESIQDPAFFSGDLAFFNAHFKEENYEVYRSFYLNNACLASAEDFKNWRSTVLHKTITPVARYLLYSGADTFSIISYTLTSATGKQYFPMALQRVNQKWYLLNIRQSEEMMNLKMFLSFVRQSFMDDFLHKQEEMKAKYIASLFTSKGNLNGDLMMNYFDARYDPSAPRHELALETFHEVATYPEDYTEMLKKEIRLLAAEYKIPDHKIAIIENMASEGNYSLGIQKIAEWSNTFDVIEVTSKFQLRMNVHSKATTPK